MRTLERMHADHHATATRLDRWIDRLTAAVGQPAAVLALTGLCVAWVGVNMVLAVGTGRAPDPPPYAALQTVMAVAALYVTLMILASQRRAARLTFQREQLTLELVILSERKVAKIIALLEELRRDHPELADRIDEQARAMAEPSDTEIMLEAARAAADDAAQGGGGAAAVAAGGGE